MSVVDVRPAEECRWDLVSLGEVMLRLDPGERRIATTRRFDVWEGGGEYNVARGLRRCFGMRSAVVTALADNDVGRLVEDLILQGGVECAHLQWVPYDGVGRAVRNGINFVERGYGVRGARGVSDRGHTAVSQLRPGDVDWDRIFGEEGARWLHCGGVFAGLSESTAEVAREAMEAARRHGTIVSYDLNYRPSLWTALGGEAAAAKVNGALVDHVDVLIGNEEDFYAGLGYDAGHGDGDFLELDVDRYAELLGRVMADRPTLSIAGSTLRQAHTASVNDWSAVCRTRDGFHVGPSLERLDIFDRVGGGDSFASGLIYGLLNGDGIERALALGVAHGALAMTTPGDTSMARLDEVERMVAGGSARIVR
jgi:2-dehydro-3-deoxygluconokinase